MNKLIALAALVATAAAQCDGVAKTFGTAPTDGSADCSGALLAASTCMLTCTNGETAGGAITCDGTNYDDTTVPPTCPAAATPCDGSDQTFGTAPTNGTATCSAAIAAGQGCASMTCANGETASGAITCLADGTYDTTTGAPTCPPAAAAATPCSGDDQTFGTAPLDGSAVCSTATTAGVDCETLTCNNGATATGAVTCLASGLYDVTTNPPTCPAATPCNGTDVVSFGADAALGSADCTGITAAGIPCELSCTTASYVASGSVTCTASGTYDSTTDAPMCAAAASGCDGMWTDGEGNAGSTVDCSKALLDGQSCDVKCYPALVQTGMTPMCVGSTMSYTQGGTCLDTVEITDEVYKKAGCTVTEAIAIAIRLRLSTSFFAGGAEISLKQAFKLVSDGNSAILAGKKLPQATYDADLKGVTLTEEQTKDLKELLCVGSNFVTAAAALAVAFVLSK